MLGFYCHCLCCSTPPPVTRPYAQRLLPQRRRKPCRSAPVLNLICSSDAPCMIVGRLHLPHFTNDHHSCVTWRGIARLQLSQMHLLEHLGMSEREQSV